MRIVSERVLFTGGPARPGWVEVEDGRISAVGEGACENATQVHTLVPGLVDLHVHGADGADASRGECAAMAAALAAAGTTSALFTLYPAGVEDLDARLSAAAADGVEGVHIEGPFFHPDAAGGLDAAAAAEEGAHAPFLDLLERHAPLVKRVTLAPDRPEARELVGGLAALGITPSFGHTLATLAECRAAAGDERCSVTHLFNAMRPFHHREPGTPGWTLMGGPAWTEVIADGVHVGSDALQIVLRARGLDGLTLVSDALPGSAPGEDTFQAGGLDLVCDGPVARVSGTDTIAGSLQSLLSQVSGLVRGGTLGFEEAFLAATATPAAAAGWEGRKGIIAPGADADLVALDADLGLASVWTAGHAV